MKEFCLDLKEHFNTRLIFPADADEKEVITPLENYWLYEEDFSLGKTVRLNGTEFLFDRSGALLDCIECRGQFISLPHVTLKRLDVAGFCCWGDFRERAELILSTGSLPITFRLADWCYPQSEDPDLFEQDSAYAREGCEICFGPCKSRDRMWRMYRCTIDLPCRSTLRGLKLPDNFFMYLFAMTASAGGERRGE